MVIPQAYQWSESKTMIGVWLTADGTAPSLGASAGTAGGVWMDNSAVKAASSDTTPYPLHLRGRNGGGVRVWGDLALNSGQITSLPGQDLILWPGFNQVRQSDGSYKVYQDTLKARSGGVDWQNMSGVMEFTSNTSAEFNAIGTTTIRGASNLFLQSNRDIALKRTDGSAYTKSWTSGGLKTLYIGGSSGTVYTDSSSIRYKTCLLYTSPSPRD